MDAFCSVRGTGHGRDATAEYAVNFPAGHLLLCEECAEAFDDAELVDIEDRRVVR